MDWLTLRVPQTNISCIVVAKACPQQIYCSRNYQLCSFTAALFRTRRDGNSYNPAIFCDVLFESLNSIRAVSPVGAALTIVPEHLCHFLWELLCRIESHRAEMKSGRLAAMYQHAGNVICT